MNVLRLMFPLEETRELPQLEHSFVNVIAHKESEETPRDLLFQSALSSLDQSVTFITKKRFDTVPKSVHGLSNLEEVAKKNPELLERLNFVYPETYAELVSYLVALPSLPSVPYLILIDSLDVFVEDDDDKELLILRLFALLYDLKTSPVGCIVVGISESWLLKEKLGPFVSNFWLLEIENECTNQSQADKKKVCRTDKNRKWTLRHVSEDKQFGIEFHCYNDTMYAPLVLFSEE